MIELNIKFSKEVVSYDVTLARIAFLIFIGVKFKP